MQRRCYHFSITSFIRNSSGTFPENGVAAFQNKIGSAKSAADFVNTIPNGINDVFFLIRNSSFF